MSSETKTVPNPSQQHPAPVVDPVQLEVEELLAGVDFRQPIVDEYVPEIHDARPGEDIEERIRRVEANEKAAEDRNSSIDHKWLAITEASRRAIINDPETRKAVTQFNSLPLNEALPSKAIGEIAQKDARTARLSRLTNKTLGSFLELEAVPDEVLKPDIRNAPRHIRKEQEVKRLTSWKKRDSSEDFDQTLESTVRRVTESPGVTSAERDLVARRYRYARDVKVLGLMAELKDNPLTKPEVIDGLVAHELPSGIKMVMTEAAFAGAPSLLDPQQWQSRRQLKDRVHVVNVDGVEYILKERKTDRHVDVKKHSHKDGLTSKQEFEVASQFAEKGTIKEGDVQLHWEKPLGYVEFPDGYQFCLFASEPNMKTDRPRVELTQAIIEAKDQYLEEYERIKSAAKDIYHNRGDLVREYEKREPVPPKRFPVSSRSRHYKKLYKQEPEPDELTFEEFAELKANYMLHQATEMLSNTIRQEGYENSDMDGYGFRILTDKRPKLEMIGFDFEYYYERYYSSVPEADKAMADKEAEYNKSGKLARNNSYRLADKRAIMLAASYPMMEQIGWATPPKKNPEQ